jgi:hypothetical protein
MGSVVHGYGRTVVRFDDAPANHAIDAVTRRTA